MSSNASGGVYAGGAWSKTLPGGKGSGSLRLEGGMLLFESEKGRVEMPLSGLDLKLGGAADRVLFFTHPEQPQWTLHTSDHAILSHPSMQGFADLAGKVRGVKRKKLVGLSIVGGLILAVVGFFACFWIFRAELAASAARQVPVAWERQMSEAAFSHVTSGRRMLEDPAVKEQLEALTSPLVQAVNSKRYTFEFHIVEDPSVNAFAMPGGIVVIHTGLIDKAERPEEILGVLSHEIAHVTEQHSVRQMISSAGLYVLISAFFGDLTGMEAVLLEGGGMLLERRFSRDHEREADEVGWDVLVKAGIDPSGMRTFFEKLKQEEKKHLPGEVGEALSLLGTHPATDERIRRMKERDESLPEGAVLRKVDFDLEAFKQAIRTE